MLVSDSRVRANGPKDPLRQRATCAGGSSRLLQRGGSDASRCDIRSVIPTQIFSFFRHATEGSLVRTSRCKHSRREAPRSSSSASPNPSHSRRVFEEDYPPEIAAVIRAIQALDRIRSTRSSFLHRTEQERKSKCESACGASRAMMVITPGMSSRCGVLADWSTSEFYAREASAQLIPIVCRRMRFWATLEPTHTEWRTWTSRLWSVSVFGQIASMRKSADQLQAGVYTLVVSTFEPGTTAAYTLDVESTTSASITPIPQEGAGMFHRSAEGVW